MAATEVWSGDYLWRQLENALLNPIRAFRPRYLPLLMVYFAYGALGLIAVAESFWVKKALTLSPAQLAELAVWTTLPWTVKMVFGELVDSVPILGSQRRAYVFIGAAFIAAGLLLLAGAAGGWLTFASPENLYRLGAFCERARRRDPGRRRRRHEHRGRRPREPGRHAARQGRGRPRARHGAGARAPCACRSACSSSPASPAGSPASTATRRCSSSG